MEQGLSSLLPRHGPNTAPRPAPTPATAWQLAPRVMAPASCPGPPGPGDRVTPPANVPEGFVLPSWGPRPGKGAAHGRRGSCAVWVAHPSLDM